MLICIKMGVFPISVMFSVGQACQTQKFPWPWVWHAWGCLLETSQAVHLGNQVLCVRRQEFLDDSCRSRPGRHPALPETWGQQIWPPAGTRETMRTCLSDPVIVSNHYPHVLAPTRFSLNSLVIFAEYTDPKLFSQWATQIVCHKQELNHLRNLSKLKILHSLPLVLLFPVF